MYETLFIGAKQACRARSRNPLSNMCKEMEGLPGDKVEWNNQQDLSSRLLRPRTEKRFNRSVCYQSDKFLFFTWTEHEHAQWA